jgi:hypothetical protein
MSNDAKSTQRDEKFPTDYTHMLPDGSHKKIRSVNIHYDYHILGFSFRDKDGVLIWEIGDNRSKWDVKTVELAENEKIVGVVCKLFHGKVQW